MPEPTSIGALPSELDFEKSLMFFHAYMYGPLQGKLRIYRARTVPTSVVAMSSDWEVFASMLVNDLGRKLGAGVDLANNEVKSAKTGNSYEYQYHKLAGRAKLARDCEVGHLFFEYTSTLSEVHLRYMHGSELRQDYFEKWLASLPKNYQQRYRKSIPYSLVKNRGKLLMTLKDGEVAFPRIVDNPARETNQLQS